MHRDIVVKKGLAAASLALAMAGEAGASPGLADPSAGPLLSRVEISATVNLEVRDWRALHQGNASGGLPLVLLTGLGNTAAVYDDLAPLLARRQPVVALTRRGFGGSSAPATGYDVATRVNDLRLALDRLGLERVVLVGHSIAGDELTAFAGRFPERVAAMVYLDAAINRFAMSRSNPGNACMEALREQAAATASPDLFIRPAGAEPRARSHGALARLIAMDFPPFPQTELYGSTAWIPGGGVDYPTSAKQAAEALSQGTERYRPDYRPLRMPLLALYAGQSPLDRLLPSIPAEQQSQARACRQANARWLQAAGPDDLRTQRTDATIAIWPDASHHLFLEHPQRTADAIQRFVAGLAGAQAKASIPSGLQCNGVELVSLLLLEPRPLIELRYASPYNFLGTILYPALEPRLRCPVALALQQVQQDLAGEGLGLKIWDAYRPLAVQQQMWDAIRDPRYVSDPAVNAGRHTRGTAVDATLVDRRGRELPMPTDFDDFSEAAHQDAPGISKERAANARRLRQAMERRGFRAFATEWWHFDWKDWERLPVVPQGS
ncbi:MAG: alpha/beta fold hydrolase [Cyanobium sp.]